MAVSRLIADLRRPDQILFSKIVAFWTPISGRLPCNGYTEYISPNKALKAWTNDVMQMIALLWDRHTGQKHQVNREALYEFITDMGGWI